MVKKCTKCGFEKSIYDFNIRKKNLKRAGKNPHKNPRPSCGRRSHCKDCMALYYKSEKIKKYREINREKINKRARDYYYTNEEYRQRKKESFSSAEYRKYQKRKIETNIQYKLSRILRSRLRAVVKGHAKTGSAVRDLGCSMEELKEHLRKQFTVGMTWENHGKWHVDHIIPLSSFDLTDREQLLKAVNFTNLQPLWARDNWSKGNRVMHNLGIKKLEEVI